MLQIGSGLLLSGCSSSYRAGEIMTVEKSIPSDQLGFTLIHEHIAIHYKGAKADYRWTTEEKARILEVMTKESNLLKAKGVTAIVDCTPAFMGRDPFLLKKLVSDTDSFNIITNTGFHGGGTSAFGSELGEDPFLPDWVRTASAEDLAAHWTAECKNGIEDSGVRPGFIKIGVDEVEERRELSENDSKLATAAAIASKQTGVVVVCHTQGVRSANQVCDKFGDQQSRLIIAHAHEFPADEINSFIDRGVRLSFDGINRGSYTDDALLTLLKNLSKTQKERVLLSQDAGYYATNSKLRDFRLENLHYVTETLLPNMHADDELGQSAIELIFEKNPAGAFAIA